MDISVWTLIAQLINFAIIFFAFKYFLWDTLTRMLLERKEQLRKLQKAQTLVANAEKEAMQAKEKLIQEGLTYKQRLEEEARWQAKRLEEELLAQAEVKAQQHLTDAHKKAEQLERDLKEWFMDGVKTTTKLVVHKLFEKDVNLKEEYIQELVQEFSAQK